LESAILASHLRDRPADVSDDLMVGAVRRKIPASVVIHREGEGAAVLELVVSGIVRLFVTAPHGRTIDCPILPVGCVLGVIERNRIVILHPARLIAEQDWNPGP
jgi:CRP/FNR family transcriptional regulator, cyclic AMP receptor protein